MPKRLVFPYYQHLLGHPKWCVIFPSIVSYHIIIPYHTTTTSSCISSLIWLLGIQSIAMEFPSPWRSVEFWHMSTSLWKSVLFSSYQTLSTGRGLRWRPATPQSLPWARLGLVWDGLMLLRWNQMITFMLKRNTHIYVIQIKSYCILISRIIYTQDCVLYFGMRLFPWTYQH